MTHGVIQVNSGRCLDSLPIWFVVYPWLSLQEICQSARGEITGKSS